LEYLFRTIELAVRDQGLGQSEQCLHVDIPSTGRLTAQFRQDLKISAGGSNKSGGKAYLVEDPVTHESFSFGEEEYFLCKAMDGTSTSEDSVDQLKRARDP
jgi:hypothetical protein